MRRGNSVLICTKMHAAGSAAKLNNEKPGMHPQRFMTKFNTGDRVTNGRVGPLVNHNGKAFDGIVGIGGSGPWILVKLDNGIDYDFYPDELSLEFSAEIIYRASDSPNYQQPPQTKPKEENMRYVVLYKNLASDSGAAIQNSHTTEADAKLRAEQLVAQQRASIQTKAYFTIAIVDMQTGKMVGSVTDAPPPVNWQNEE